MCTGTASQLLQASRAVPEWTPAPDYLCDRQPDGTAAVAVGMAGTGALGWSTRPSLSNWTGVTVGGVARAERSAQGVE